MHSAGAPKPSGKRSCAGSACRQRAHLRADRRDHELAALVERAARVVERVDRGLGLEVQVAPRIEAREHVREERRHVVDRERWVVAAVRDQQVLRERHLALAEHGVRLREQLGRPL